MKIVPDLFFSPPLLYVLYMLIYLDKALSRSLNFFIYILQMKNSDLFDKDFLDI